jgi:hypothetical protein
MKKLHVLLSLIGLLAILSVPLCGQGAAGSISGTVTDEQGAVIPNAKIVVTNRDTGFTRELTSSANGSYSVLSLDAGTYGIRVEAGGFSGRERAATVQVGTATRVDFLLHVGTQKDVVQVEEAAPQMNYESSAVSGVVTRTQIQDLPLNGRSFLNLASIEPGVGVSTGGTSQYNAQFSVSILGGSSGRTAYTVDGGNIRDDIENTGPSQNFSQEVIQEFQVNSVNFDLSTGITSVGSVNIVTRSGGNKLHGSGYFYFRDHNMAAYPSLARSASDPNPFFARRDPGFWLGGPIKKDKLFFFFNYEYQSQATAVIFTPTQGIPSVGGLGGNFLNPYKGKTLSAKFDYRLSTKHTLFARYSHDGNSAYGPQGGATLPSNWLVNANWSDLSTLGVTSTFTPSLVNDFRFNYQYWHNRNLFPTQADCPNCIGQTGAIAPQISVDLTNVTVGHTSNATQGRDLRQFQFNDSMSWIKGNHRIRFGGEFQYTPGTGFWGFCDPFCGTVAPPELIKASLTGPLAAAIPLYFPTLPKAINTDTDLMNSPFLGAIIGIGNPAQPPPYNENIAKNNNRFHPFIQDTWKFRPNFTVNLGFAWSYESNLLNFDLKRPAFLAPLYGSDLTPPTNNDHNFTPSIGFNWSPWKNNKTTVHGGFGIYYDTAQLYQRLQERAEIGPVGNGRIQEPNTAILNTFPGIVDFSAGGVPVPVGSPIPYAHLLNMTLGQFEQDEQSQIGAVTAALSTSAAASGLTTIDIAKSGSDLYAHSYPMMHSIQFNLGAQREIRKDLVLTVDYVRRVFLNVDLGAFDFNHYNRYINGIQTPVIPKCTGANASTPGVECSNGPITFWNPGGRNVYNGFLAKLDKRFANRYQFTASWSLSRTSGYDTLYNQDDWNAAWESGKWGQNLNIVATYNMKWGFTLSGITTLGGKGNGDVIVPGAVDLTGSGNTTTPLPGLSLGCINNGCSASDIVNAVNSWNTTYAGKTDARCPNPTVATNSCPKNPTIQVPTNFYFGRPFFSQDLRVTKSFNLGSEKYKLAIFGEVFNLFNYANMNGQSYTLDAVGSGVGFGIPTGLAGQQLGSGGSRAFQVGSRFTF